MRGVDEDELAGHRAAVVNVDYRFPLMRIDRGVGTLPVFARVLHGAVFVDAGHAWTSSVPRAGRPRSLGAELSLDAVLGYVLPLTFTAGARGSRRTAASSGSAGSGGLFESQPEAGHRVR